MPRAVSPAPTQSPETASATIVEDSDAEKYVYKGKPIEVRDVWAHNLEEEMLLIREVAEHYHFVAMDTEFPGLVIKPILSAEVYRKNGHFNYLQMKANVDVLQMIQIGFTFFDKQGSIPMIGDTQAAWQFNFREFDPQQHPHAQDSVDLLQQSGINFGLFRQHGVDARRFAELLTISGVVLNEEMTWVTFHSMYDFGYLLKCLVGHKLPDTEKEFFQMLKIYFPTYYDMKHMQRSYAYGGLNSLADHLQVVRYGQQHQAGSDSLLTAVSFLALVDRYFQEQGTLEKHEGVLFGLNDGHHWQQERDDGAPLPAAHRVRI